MSCHTVGHLTCAEPDVRSSLWEQGLNNRSLVARTLKRGAQRVRTFALFPSTPR